MANPARIGARMFWGPDNNDAAACSFLNVLHSKGTPDACSSLFFGSQMIRCPCLSAYANGYIDLCSFSIVQLTLQQ